MRYRLPLRAGSALVLGSCLGLTGCARAPSGAPAAAPISVTVSYPVARYVTDYADFTGQTEAVESVDVRPRVSGYLKEIGFKPGGEVKKDQILFVIDPRPYEAQLAQAEAQVKVAEAQLSLAQASFNRVRSLTGSAAVSPQEIDQARQEFYWACGANLTADSFDQLSGHATITGVEFLDRSHGQSGRDDLGDGFRGGGDGKRGRRRGEGGKHRQ